MKRVLFFVCVVLLSAGCRDQNESAADRNASPGAIVSSTPPFKTKEPDRYRAVRVITVASPGGETVVTRNLIARDGEMRRNESGKLAYLEIPEGKFVLIPEDKVYAEFTDGGGNSTEPTPPEIISPERFLHDETGVTSYQTVGTEVIDGRNSSKFRVVVKDSGAGNVSVSETLIWIDEELEMPVRSETTAKDGARITTELADLALEVDKDIFQLPRDYKKISFAELRRRLIETRVR